MTVLVLAREVDPHVDRVVEALLSRDVPVFRTDLSAFPVSLTLDFRLGPKGWDGELANEYRSVRLNDIRSVWYRHPSHFAFPEGMSRSERRHATAEGKCGLGGTLSRLNGYGSTVHRGSPTRESPTNSMLPGNADCVCRLAR